MHLLFNPEPTKIHWCLAADGGKTVGTMDLRGDWRAALAGLLPEVARLEAIGHLLPQGGDLFESPVQAVVSQTIEMVDAATQDTPEQNSVSVGLLRYWAERRPGTPQVLFCDTAFFADLPAEVRDYAVPPEITRRGIHRRGGNGLCHEQSWEQVKAHTGGAARKVVSVFLGDRPDVAAIREGTAVETTVGLTNLEGVLSAGGCGDIDPTIIFQLGASGMQYAAISRMLSRQSGFTGLAGRPCRLGDLLAGAAQPGVVLARRVLVYQLAKYIGAFIAVLGGVDTVVFTSDNPLQTLPIAREVCSNLAFLGVQCDWDSEPELFPHVVSTKDSGLRIVLTSFDLWETMVKRISLLMSDPKEMKE